MTRRPLNPYETQQTPAGWFAYRDVYGFSFRSGSRHEDAKPTEAEAIAACREAIRAYALRILDSLAREEMAK